MKYQPSCPDLQVRLQLWQKWRNKINHNSLVVKLRAQCKSTSKNFACNQQDLRLQINLVRLKKKKKKGLSEQSNEKKKWEMERKMVKIKRRRCQRWKRSISTVNADRIPSPRGHGGFPESWRDVAAIEKAHGKKTRNAAHPETQHETHVPCALRCPAHDKQCKGAWRSIRFGTFISSNNASACWIAVR